jgi:5-methylcytosine-specific restriction endonuclease McrA
MASLTSTTNNKVKQEYTIDSKQIIEKEIAHLKNLMLFSYGITKIEYEKIIKIKEEELKNCEEWINLNRPALIHNIELIEKSIEEYNQKIQNGRDLNEFVKLSELINKMKEELKVYNDKLNALNIPKKEVKLKKEKEQKPQKEPKIKEAKPPKEVKPKKKSISSTIKKLVWNTNIGEEFGKAKCVCCKSTDITQMSFNCGHVISEHNGGETIVSNLKPICQNCNSSMGTKDMNEFMLSLM